MTFSIYSLYKQLEKKERGNLAIQNFPKKKFWGNFEPDVIESRKAQLNGIYKLSDHLVSIALNSSQFIRVPYQLD